MSGERVGRKLAAWKVLAILATALSAALSFQVRSLYGYRAEVRRLREDMRHLHPGQHVPTVRAATLAGDSVTLGETAPGRSQVLIFFTTTCPYCRATLPAWRDLSRSLLADRAGRHDVYWISLSSRDSTRQYVADHAITAPVVFLPDKKDRRVYGVHGVPVTVVLDGRGRVVHARRAALETAASIDSVLLMAERANAMTIRAQDSSAVLNAPPKPSP
jgi:peroxiredoxin